MRDTLDNRTRRTWRGPLALGAVVAVALALLVAPASAVAEGPAGIVAIVGEDVITRSELDRELFVQVGNDPEIGLEAVRRHRPELERELLQHMENELLILQEIARNYAAAEAALEEKDPKKKRSADVDLDSLHGRTGEPSFVRKLSRYVPDVLLDQEIERRMEELRQAGFPVASRQEFYRFVESTHHMGAADFRSLLRRKIAVAKYKYERMFRRVDTWVTPEEMRYYYLAHKDDFTVPVKVSFRRIVLKDDRSGQEFIRQQIDAGLAKGVPFIELAQRYSQDYTNPALRGGVETLSFEEILQYREPMPTILRTLTKDEVSKPVLVGRTICYFKLEDRVEGKPKPFEEVQQRINQTILEERQRLAYQKEIDRLRRETVIREFVPGLAGETELSARERNAAGEANATEDSSENASSIARPAK